MISNNKIAPIIEKIQQAAKPQKFTIQVLRYLGFTSTNDRAFISLAKKLGFLADDRSTTALYDQLKDKTTTRTILGTQIRSLYSELYAINVEIYNASESEIKGAISRVTGKSEDGVVNRIYNTFKALCNNADFDNRVPVKKPVEEDAVPSIVPINLNAPLDSPQFHYNIQIHLPATTDVSVYNAIFKSLKDHLIL